MSTYYINGEPCELLARVRRAGLPFERQDSGYLVGIDYQDFTGGGGCNVRLTVEQATALRDALSVYLSCSTEYIIARRADGTLVRESKP